MRKFRLVLTALVCLLPIGRLKNLLLNCLGHVVHLNARIGLSVVVCDRLYLQSNARIGPFNILKIPRLLMRRDSSIGRVNVFSGDFIAVCGESSRIKNFNIVTRGRCPWVGPNSRIRLGAKAQITSLASIDLASSVIIGSDTVLAGKGIQIWTHGFVHEVNRRRNLIVAPVILGVNCYVGARTCFNPGVTITDNVSIGVNSTVSRDLDAAGLYVSGPMRRIDFDPTDRLYSMTRLNTGTFEYFQKDRSRNTG